MDFNTVGDRTFDMKPGEKDFDIFTMGFSLSIDPDPSGALFDYDAFVEGGFCATGYYNERAQELIKLGREEFDQEKRAEIYKEWCLLMNEEVPLSLVTYRKELWGVNDRVKGLENMTAYARFPGIVEMIELEGEDQILKFGETSFDGRFNPIMSDNVYDSYVVSLVFDGLVDNTPEGEYVPDLGTWEISNEHRTYTFTLKDGVCFSDGTPLTTDDVLFTYMMIAHPDYTGPRLYAVSGLEGYEAYAAGEADEISGLEVIDEKTIAFTFAVASPANIEYLAYGIMPRAYYEADTFEAFLLNIDKPLGSGKFVFDDYGPNEFIILSANEGYWNPERAVKIEGIYWTNVPSESKIPALQLGQLDFAQVGTNLDNANAIEEMEGFHLISYLGNGYTFMAFNTLR